MYFSRLTLRSKTNPLQITRLQGYKEHQVLWKVFERDPDATRDFLFRREGQAEATIYYVVSHRKPLADQSRWHIESKEYAPKLCKGQYLAFKLRLNPVVTRSKENGKKSRIDLIVDHKAQIGWKELAPKERPPLQQLVQRSGEQWMAKRQERLGLEVVALTADSYQKHKSFKPAATEPISYSTIDLQGTVKVADTEALLTALFKGVGAAKAMGCGLMLIKPM